MDSVGERIKRRRKELNLTQIQISSQTGISSGNLSSYEQGKILPSAVAIVALSKILHCSTDWLLTGESLISNNLSLSKDEETFLEYFKKLSMNDKEEILLLMKLKCKRSEGKKSPCSNLGNEQLA